MKAWFESKQIWRMVSLALAGLALALAAWALAFRNADPIGSTPFANERNAELPVNANVVKIGMRVQSLGPPDIATETFPATFDVWFIAAKPFDASDLVFPDAVAPIHLGKPAAMRAIGDQTYQLYHVSGAFRYQPSVDGLFTNRLTLRIALLSANSARSQLVLSPDPTASQLAPLAPTGGQPVSADGDWNVSRTWLGEVAVDEATLGDPTFASSHIGHSEIVALFSLDQSSGVIGFLRRLTPPILAAPIALAMLALLAAAILSKRRAASIDPYRSIAGLGSASLLLAAVESFLGANASSVFSLAQARVARTAIEGAWLALIAAWLMALMPILIWRPVERRTGTPASVLERVGVNVVICLALGLVFLSSTLNLSAVSIGATSGVLTLILGFALQNIILDLFSGILLNLEKPFRLLHWITVDTSGVRVFGQVRNMNWRTTQLQTRDNTLVSVPNSVVAKSNVFNHANPAAFSQAKFEVVLSPKVPTATARQVMKEGALRSAETGLILEQPGPSVVVTGVEDYGVRYRVFFYVNLNVGSDAATLNSVAENVLAALAEARIEIALRYDILVRQTQDELRSARAPHPVLVSATVPELSARRAAPIPASSSPLSAAEIELVRTSWTRARAHGEEIAAAFYDRLFSVAPAVRPLFRADAKTQRTKFVTMLGVLVKAADQLEGLRDTLADFGLRHRTYGAQFEHYGVVGDVLLWTLQHKLGDSFDQRTAAAWAKLYGEVAEMMTGAREKAA
ncbi:MAG: mechanosensitive ion channel [Hyphomicrobiales bacterium]|nr:mechanosensitive ion channel [Hyphomicrobiales bacterium]MBV9909502.1 mechanosensitive ion channel [Hyphomicrobiales bacterium]